MVYEERWGLEWWSTPYIPPPPPPLPDVTLLMAHLHRPWDRERESVQIFSEVDIVQVKVKLLQEKVSPPEQTWCTPNISSQLGLEVSSYNWQKRLLQRVTLINGWKLMFLLKLIHPSIRPKNLVSNVLARCILDLTGNLTLLTHSAAWHIFVPTYQCVS